MVVYVVGGELWRAGDDVVDETAAGRRAGRLAATVAMQARLVQFAVALPGGAGAARRVRRLSDPAAARHDDDDDVPSHSRSDERPLAGWRRPLLTTQSSLHRRRRTDSTRQTPAW